MKAVLALAATLSVVSASNILPRQLDQIPQCALQCALGSLTSTGCETTDFKCICEAEAFVNGLVPCVQAGCSADEFDKTLAAAKGLCSAAGATLVIPTGAASTSGPASSSETEAPSSTAGTETTAETTTAPGTESTPAETTSAPSTTEASTTDAPQTTAGSNNGTQTGTRPPNPTGTEPGAASRNTVALGSLGAIIALVAAFL